MSKPALKYSHDNKPSRQNTQLPEMAPVNILIVDDLPEKILVYKTILEDLNQNLITAMSGEDALRLVLKHEFAVILLDVNMPGMDGFETASLIRGCKKSMRTPIIFLTAFTDEINSAQGYATGAVDYLPTPVVPEVLRAKIRVFIELFQMRQLAAFQAEERAKREAAEEADRRKDEFLATLAHELRNPLAPMRNALNLLQLPNIQPKMIAHAYQMMERQMNHMIRLVDDLMDVSRITRGRVDLRLDNILLADAIESAVETARPLIEERRHTLDIKAPDKTVMVKADLIRLSQVMVNLLNNAAKYTDTGGRIILKVDKKGEWVSVSIQDTGMGIVPEEAANIFGLFMQVDNSIGRSQGGLGIGLTLAKNLIEMQGGAIDVHSDGVNKGSTFTIKIPAAEASAQKASPEQQIAATGNQKIRRVLIVDDNQDSAKTLGWMLEILGHSTCLAFDGPQAIQAAKNFMPELILLDVGMPGMNGYEVCEALKKEDGFEKVVFVAQTGWGQEEHRRLSRKAGFDYHLVKPICSDNLSAILEAVP